MNIGERDELLIQIKLISLRDSKTTLDFFENIESVGFTKEYQSIPNGVDLSRINSWDDQELSSFAMTLGICKASGNYKADTIINDIPISLKSIHSAPPAIVNHTTRPGFQFAASNSSTDIRLLDDMVNEYWEKRFDRIIGEDVRNNNPLSPFGKHKEKLRPIINFFLFKGTGSSLSKLPADKILSFSNPLDPTTWSVFDEKNAINLFWDNMIFSLRSKKGMPQGYPDKLSSRMYKHKASIDKWTRFIDDNYRGALHIRTGS